MFVIPRRVWNFVNRGVFIDPPHFFWTLFRRMVIPKITANSTHDRVAA